jgi:hypothetical protein
MTDKLELGNVNHGEYVSYADRYSSVRVELLYITPGQLDKFLTMCRAFCKNPTCSADLDVAAAAVEVTDFRSHKKEVLPKPNKNSSPPRSAAPTPMENEITDALEDTKLSKKSIADNVLKDTPVTDKRYAAFYVAWGNLAKRGLIVAADPADRDTLWSKKED